MMQRIFFRSLFFPGLRIEKIIEAYRGLRCAVHVGLFARLDDRVGDNMRDFLLRCPRGQRELLIVALATHAVAQYAAGMIDEAKRLFDVSLAIARLGVILTNEPTQRRPHLFIGGAWLDTQRFVERGLHSLTRKNSIMPLILKRRHLRGILGKARSGPLEGRPAAESLVRSMAKGPTARPPLSVVS